MLAKIRKFSSTIFAKFLLAFIAIPFIFWGMGPLFTSGSTGPPKGVVYTHEMFSRQLEVLRYCYQIKQQDVDLSTFPLFSLFGVGIGMTSIIPEMDFSCPAKVNPEKILKTISKYKITSGFGSPALWNTISRYCISNNRNLYSINRILMAGAPISGSLIKKFDHILNFHSYIHIPRTSLL